MNTIRMIPVFAIALLVHSGCTEVVGVDSRAPASPRGVRALSLDNSVEITWLSNTEPDLYGYIVWVSDRYNGAYQIIGKTRETIFVDRDAINGVTYYYAVSAYDFENNESALSADNVSATPRPEGFGVRADDYRLFPLTAGYDFSTYSVGRYDDQYTDVYFEHFQGRYYLNVWTDSDIQGMGFTQSLDEITRAPTSGWAPSKSVEAIPGHTYVVWTWDDHYAKLRVKQVSSSRVVFDWAYQTAPGNPQLRPGSVEGKRKPLR